MKGCLLMLLIHVGKICTYDEDVAYRNVIYKKTALWWRQWLYLFIHWNTSIKQELLRSWNEIKLVV